MGNLPINKAKELRTKAGFPPYQGERLTGPRSELSYGNDTFPKALRLIPDPPEKIYLIGEAAALSEGLAIVGARKATPYGLSCARHFAGRAAERGITVISGGAVGCDSAAHEAALEKGGRTLVFLGGGCDELYPAKNRDLFQRIIDSHGAVASEYPWDYPPLRHTFRRRNRLIAGLSRATMIVEAGLPSGTFSTADEALNADKDVLVVPGSIFSKSSHGANRLIYQGATPVVDDEVFDDLLFGIFGLLRQEVAGSSSHLPKTKLTATEEKIYGYLCAQPMHVDEIFRILEQSGDITDLSRLGKEITGLEMKGLIARYPDGTYGGKG